MFDPIGGALEGGEAEGDFTRRCLESGELALRRVQIRIEGDDVNARGGPEGEFVVQNDRFLCALAVGQGTNVDRGNFLKIGWI